MNILCGMSVCDVDCLHPQSGLLVFSLCCFVSFTCLLLVVTEWLSNRLISWCVQSAVHCSIGGRLKKSTVSHSASYRALCKFRQDSISHSVGCWALYRFRQDSASHSASCWGLYRFRQDTLPLSSSYWALHGFRQNIISHSASYWGFYRFRQNTMSHSASYWGLYRFRQDTISHPARYWALYKLPISGDFEAAVTGRFCSYFISLPVLKQVL